jgi:hypothetical protein
MPPQGPTIPNKKIIKSFTIIRTSNEIKGMEKIAIMLKLTRVLNIKIT